MSEPKQERLCIKCHINPRASKTCSYCVPCERIRSQEYRNRKKWMEGFNPLMQKLIQMRWAA